MKNPKYTKLLLATALILTAPLTQAQTAAPMGATEGPDARQQAVRAKMAELEQEFREVAGKLQTIEQEALAKPEIAKAKSEFETMLSEQIVEAKPELKETVEKRSKYSKYIDRVKAGKSLPEDMAIGDVYTEYNKLHQEIMPVEQQVMQEEEIMQAYNEFRQNLLASMEAIDDKARDYMMRQNELRDSYQELVRQIQG